MKPLKKIGILLLSLVILGSISLLPTQAAQTVDVSINGTMVDYNDRFGYPFLDNAGRTQVPFRITLETFGCTVTWDNATRSAIAQKDGTTVQVPIGQAYLLVNGHKVMTDTTALLINERTYLPIRPVMEAFGANVTWNGADRCVLISTGSPLTRVHFIDVGQGDSILIDGGKTEVLIDGGDNQAGPTVVSYLAPYIDDKLDYVIATHPDADHVGGLDDVLEAYTVGEVIDSGYTASSATYRDYLSAAKNEPGCTFSYDENRVISLGAETVLSILEAGDNWKNPNDSSIVCELICGNVSVLFVGDLSQTVEKASLSLFGDVDVLKVGHHGSATSSSAQFLSVVRPECAVASYAPGNRYGHPSRQALERLFAAGTSVYGTGKSGAIVLTTDGHSYSFNTSTTLNLADAGR